MFTSSKLTQTWQGDMRSCPRPEPSSDCHWHTNTHKGKLLPWLHHSLAAPRPCLSDMWQRLWPCVTESLQTLKPYFLKQSQFFQLWVSMTEGRRNSHRAFTAPSSATHFSRSLGFSLIAMHALQKSLSSLRTNRSNRVKIWLVELLYSL